jgi:hypothetical protein
MASAIATARAACFAPMDSKSADAKMSPSQSDPYDRGSAQTIAFCCGDWKPQAASARPIWRRPHGIAEIVGECMERNANGVGGKGTV